MFVFFTSRKTTFKSQLDTSSIPCCLSSFFGFFLSQSRQLLNTQWIDRESSCLLDSFLTPGGSIELLFLYLMICSSTPHRYLYLSKTIFLIPSSTDVSTPLNTFICRDLLRVYLSFLVRFVPYFDRSLSRQLSLFLSQKISSHSNLNPQGFFKLFQDFLHLVSFLSLIIHAFHVLKPSF